MNLLPIFDDGQIIAYKRIARGFWVISQIARGPGSGRALEVMADRETLDLLAALAIELGNTADVLPEEGVEGVFVLDVSGTVTRTKNFIEQIEDVYGLPRLKDVLLEPYQVEVRSEDGVQTARAKILPT